jgi:N-acetyl-gamma-glutamyl-phosphate reductase
MKFATALLAFSVAQSSGFTLRTPLSSSARLETSLNKYKVFIDGEAGTTGLQVRGRIEARDDLEIISAPDELRKDEATRKKLINEADCVILCKWIRLVRQFPARLSRKNHRLR